MKHTQKKQNILVLSTQTPLFEGLDHHFDFVETASAMIKAAEKKINHADSYGVIFIDVEMYQQTGKTEDLNSLLAADSCLTFIFYHDSFSDDLFQKLEVSNRYTCLRKPCEAVELNQLIMSMSSQHELYQDLSSCGYLYEALEEFTVDKIQELKQSEERYILAAQSANDGLWDLDIKTGKVYFSSRFSDILGLSETERLTGIKDWYHFLHQDDIVLLPQMIQDHLNGKTERVDLECRMNTKQGKEIWVRIRGLSSRDKHKKPIRVVGFMTDISEQKEHEKALHQAAFHDELTGLSNRALFMNRLEQVIEREKRLGENKAAIMFLDLDRFKNINDTLGHQIGDEVLKIVATVLKTHTRPTDTISRMGGDEFTVLLDPVESIDEAEQISTRILEQLNRTYEINGKEAYVGSSIGLTLIDSPDTDAQIFLRNADLAMYQAKTNKKTRIEIFDHHQHNKMLDNMEIEADLRNAVKNDELLVYYQPIIDLKEGYVISFESLMRWRHPQRGFVSPGLFIPLAEELGLIGDVGLFTVESVCKQLRIWQERTKECPNISINVSVLQLMDKTMFDELYKTLSELGELTRFISIEVTETLIMKDPESIVERLKELRALRMKIYIDDFGTGYSSLSYLATFPLDVIKIDQAFVASMLTDNKAERLVASIVHLAKELELKTVAEGVETEEQMIKLIQLGCDYGQGHYFAKAMNPHVAREIVYNNTKFNISSSVRVA